MTAAVGSVPRPSCHAPRRRHFRRLCLEATGTDLGEEMEYTAEMAMQTPKNYQIWYGPRPRAIGDRTLIPALPTSTRFHRRWLVAKANDSSQEKRFTAAAIEQDSKNYHAWAHRCDDGRSSPHNRRGLTLRASASQAVGGVRVRAVGGRAGVYRACVGIQHMAGR